MTPRALDSRAKKRVLELLQAKIIDYGEVPDLQASKIIEKYKDLSKGLEKKKNNLHYRKKVTPRALASRAKNFKTSNGRGRPNF